MMQPHRALLIGALSTLLTLGIGVLGESGAQDGPRRDTTPPEILIGDITPDPTRINPSLEVIIEDSESIISSAEFFVDTDPGVGNGTALPAEDGSYDSTLEVGVATIDISRLADGTHTAFVRATDAASNTTSPAVGFPFVVGDAPDAATLCAAMAADIRRFRTSGDLTDAVADVLLDKTQKTCAEIEAERSENAIVHVLNAADILAKKPDDAVSVTAYNTLRPQLVDLGELAIDTGKRKKVGCSVVGPPKTRLKPAPDAGKTGISGTGFTGNYTLGDKKPGDWGVSIMTGPKTDGKQTLSMILTWAFNEKNDKVSNLTITVDTEFIAKIMKGKKQGVVVAPDGLLDPRVQVRVKLNGLNGADPALGAFEKYGGPYTIVNAAGGPAKKVKRTFKIEFKNLPKGNRKGEIRIRVSFAFESTSAENVGSMEAQIFGKRPVCKLEVAK